MCHFVTRTTFLIVANILQDPTFLARCLSGQVLNDVMNFILEYYLRPATRFKSVGEQTVVLLFVRKTNVGLCIIFMIPVSVVFIRFFSSKCNVLCMHSVRDLRRIVALGLF